jgi:hypothetical protein
MVLDPALIYALLPLAVMQTGAMIYFAGSVRATLIFHDDRIDKFEQSCAKCTRLVNRLAEREGIR